MTDTFPHLQKMFDKAARDRSLRLLRNMPLFSGLTDKDLRPLADHMEELRVRKNRTILESGSDAKHLYVLKEGGARLSINSHAELEFEVGAVLNWKAVSNGQPHSGTVTATEKNTRVLTIPTNDVLALIERVPSLGEGPGTG
jgi:CRP-like cAMP-binding protein